MFSGSSSIPASTSGSGSVRPQGGNGGWLTGLSTSTSTRTSADQQRKKPLREMTLAPTLTNSKEGSLNETEPVAAAAPRSGVLGWFGTSSSISSGTGNTGAVGEREEPKTQVEEAAAERSEPESTITEKEEGLLERERQVESREKELEDRKLVVDQREREVEDRSRGLEDRERVVKEGELEVQRKIEEVERREKELEERRGQFEKEREKWEEEKNRPRETEWRTAMDALKRAVDLELFAERKQAEERELELETRVMKKVTEILALDKDEQNTKLSGWKKRWDVSIKPLTRKATSSISSD